MKAVSFVVIHFDNPGYLDRCLRSIVRWVGLPGDRYEVLVVDNGSRDGACQRARLDFPGLAVARLDENEGFARAANHGISLAQAGVVALVNNDVELVEQTSVPAMLAVFDRRPDAGLLGCQLLNSDLSPQASVSFAPGLFSELVNKSLVRRGLRLAGIAPAGVREVPGVVGAWMMLRRKAWEQAGGFDPDFFFFWEETDLCARLRRAGWKILFDPDNRLVHHQGKTANRRPVQARIEYYLSRYLYFKKHFPPWARGLLRVGLFCKLLVNTAACAAAVLLTLGLAPRVRQKCALYLGLAGWHLLGCPRTMGLGAAARGRRAEPASGGGRL